MSLREAERKNQLRRRLGILTHPELLVVEEIGYPPGEPVDSRYPPQG